MKAPGTLRIHDLEFDLDTCEVVAFESESALLDHSELQYVVDEFGASKFVPRASTPRRRARR